MSRITTQIVFLAGVPLAFLLALLAVSLGLQTHNEQAAASMQLDAQLTADANRAMLLTVRADHSLGQFQRSRSQSAARSYESVRSALDSTVVELGTLAGRDRTNGAVAKSVALTFSQGIAILDRAFAAIRANDVKAQARLAASPQVRAFNSQITAGLGAFENSERASAQSARIETRRRVESYTIALFAISAVGVIATLALFLRYGLNITRRVNLLGQNARRLAEGERTQAIGGHDEISELDRVYHEMTKRIQSETARSETLQRALLPQRLPSFPGVRLDAAYMPASGGSNVGGDWYDVFKISEHLLGISIGDVAGHGLRAAAMMGSARASIRAFSYFNDSPAQVLSRANQMLCRHESGVLVTAFVATLDLIDGSLRYSFAGHPPPLIVRTGGILEHLSGGGFVLGVEPRMEYVDHEAYLDVGSALVLYTDGLVEGDGNYLGTRSLEEAVEAEYREAWHNIAHAIQGRVLSGRAARDDSAVLFVGVTALGEYALRPERVVWNIDAKSERSTRRVKRALLWHLGELTGDGSDLSPAELIVSEMLGNVARHTPGPAEVVLELAAGKATVSVIDKGPHFELPRETCPADPFAETGRGLFLIRSLSPEFSVDWNENGNRVCAVLPIDVSERASLPAALA